MIFVGALGILSMNLYKITALFETTGKADRAIQSLRFE